MAAYTNPFASVTNFLRVIGQAALPVYEGGYRMHDGAKLDQIAGVLRSMLGQNGQAPLPATFSDVFVAGSVYRSFADGLVATAGGGQGGATPITAGLNTVATVATAGDSVVLPASQTGLHPIVANAGAAALNVFPAVGDAIGVGAANAAFSVPAGKSAQFFCTAAGRWRALLSA